MAGKLEDYSGMSNAHMAYRRYCNDMAGKTTISFDKFQHIYFPNEKKKQALRLTKLKEK